MALKINPLKEHIAAEVEGVDLTAPISEETFTDLRAALYRHAVLVFHDQDITDDQHVAFSEGFGTLEGTIPGDPIGDGGLVGVFSNVDKDGNVMPPDDDKLMFNKITTFWHSDGSFRRTPLKGTILSGKVVPPEGGATEFASLVAPYAALADEIKAEIEDLEVEHSLAHASDRIAPGLMNEELRNNTPPVEHPLVREISETGEKALLIGSYARRIIGWPVEKGQALLQELLDWCSKPEYVCRHEWRANDILVYDNRLCLHRGTYWDRKSYKRILHRTTLAWDGR